MEKIIEYKNKTIKISVTKVLDFWRLQDGEDLIYIEGTEVVDETKCPKITESVYKEIFDGIEEDFKESVDNEEKFDIEECSHNRCSDLSIEDYETYNDFNVKIEVL